MWQLLLGLATGLAISLWLGPHRIHRSSERALRQLNRRARTTMREASGTGKRALAGAEGLRQRLAEVDVSDPSQLRAAAESTISSIRPRRSAMVESPEPTASEVPETKSTSRIRRTSSRGEQSSGSQRKSAAETTPRRRTRSKPAEDNAA
jgi:hypothetical protein